MLTMTLGQRLLWPVLGSVFGVCLFVHFSFIVSPHHGVWLTSLRVYLASNSGYIFASPAWSSLVFCSDFQGT